MARLLIAAIATACVFGSVGRAAELHATVKDQHGKAVADAVLLAVPMDPRNASHAKPSLEAIDQVDMQFVPYVKVIYAGSQVVFPNKDNIRHQVYSFSHTKSFELPLYGGNVAPPVSFEAPGVVVLGCNIHDWMIGYIYVADTPFFAKTAPSGTVALRDLPPGEYRVRIWHPSMERSEDTTIKRVALTDATPVDVEWQLSVKQALRIPRVTGDGSAGYP
jgi:plastocyanin